MTAGRSPRAAWRPLAAAVLVLLGPAAAAAPEAEAADRAALRGGKRLFQLGLNRQGGDLQAQIAGSVPLAGERVACARCHGTQGQGQREGGAAAPPLRWSVLAQGRAAGGGLLARAAYDETTLLRAVRQGLGADGQPLGAAMPRFQLSPREAADLVAYLRTVGTDADAEAGVTPDTVRLATALPLTGPQAAMGQALRQGIEACLARAGADTFGRRVALTVVDSHADPQALQAGALADDHLALVAPWWPDLGAAALAPRLPGLPVVGALGLAAELDGAPPHWFGVAPSLGNQARVMVDAIAEALPAQAGRVLLLAGGDAVAPLAAEAARRQAAQYPALQLAELAWPDRPEALLPALAEALRRERPAAVVVLAPAPVLEAVAALVAREAPTVRVHASQAQAGAAPLRWPAADRAVLRLTATAPLDGALAPAAYLADLQAIGARPQLPALQTLAYAAACATVESLRRAGRTLTRDGLQRGLESLRNFNPGVTPPISFGPRQRHGLWEARLVQPGAAGYEPAGPWRSPKIAD